MLPDIHLWCNTCWPIDSQHGRWNDLFHIPVTSHWWGSKLGPIMPQANTLLTAICQIDGYLAGTPCVDLHCYSVTQHVSLPLNCNRPLWWTYVLTSGYCMAVVKQWLRSQNVSGKFHFTVSLNHTFWCPFLMTTIHQ